jgi:hypothetical protein
LDKDKNKDKLKKKIIVSINIGLLEKQINIAKKSVVFLKMVDIFYYQEKYGDDISIIIEIKWNDEVYDNNCLLEMDNKGNIIEKEIEEKKIVTIMDKYKHYVLNIFGTNMLINGYKLILYYYNHEINKAYEIFMKDGVKVYSIKINVFVINKCNLGKTSEVLKFGSEIGKWR